MFNSARNGLKSLYLTTISESQFKMVRHLQEFEFFLTIYLAASLFMTVLSEFAIADEIFHLYGQEEKKFQKRYLRILKMRGTSFEQGEHLFEITPAGIKVYPRIKPAGEELQYEVKAEKKGFGIRDLDEMLNGGLPEGTITIISGGTGTGKTTFALKFLLEGAEIGEKGLLLSFEEPLAQLKSNAHFLGMGNG